MNFPQFWARAKNGDFICWRWSFTSIADAEALAAQALEQLMARFKSGNFPTSSHGGYYPNRPFREQITREIKDASGETSAVITRNSYGCLVLNTARVMFVDIDLPEPKKSGGFFKKLFGKPDVAPPNTPQSQAITRIENWTRNNSDWGWRVYRTRSGLRLLATQGLVDANAEADKVFDALGADPLYRKLCNAQKCFRARLTPKPWRCGLPEKPTRWPWLDPKQEQRFRKWLEKYQSCAVDWATCEFIKHIGNPTVHPEVQTILALHDEPTRAASKLSLA
jgi:hypothetical protein